MFQMGNMYLFVNGGLQLYFGGKSESCFKWLQNGDLLRSPAQPNSFHNMNCADEAQLDGSNLLRRGNLVPGLHFAQGIPAEVGQVHHEAIGRLALSVSPSLSLAPKPPSFLKHVLRLVDVQGIPTK